MKGDTISHDGVDIDYFERSLIPLEWDDGASLDDGESRWGEFDYEQRYAVYEEQDVRKLLKLLGCGVTKGGMGFPIPCGSVSFPITGQFVKTVNNSPFNC